MSPGEPTLEVISLKSAMGRCTIEHLDTTHTQHVHLSMNHPFPEQDPNIMCSPMSAVSAFYGSSVTEKPRELSCVDNGGSSKLRVYRARSPIETDCHQPEAMGPLEPSDHLSIINGMICMSITGNCAFILILSEQKGWNADQWKHQPYELPDRDELPAQHREVMQRV